MSKIKAISFVLLTMSTSVMSQSVTYPVTKKVVQTDAYFGINVEDPYRWLEDDRSKQTEEWVKGENLVTENYLSKISYRSLLKNKLTDLWNYQKQSVPYYKAGKLFYTKNNGIQNQGVLYMKSEKGQEQIILDPNTLATDGTVSLSSWSVSESGRYVAYALAQAGSDWNEIHIRDTKTNVELPHVIKWVKFSNMAWQGDDGFYYSKYDAPVAGKELSASNELQKIHFYKISDPVVDGALIFEQPKLPKATYGVEVSDDARFLFISQSQSTSGNMLSIKTIANLNAPIINIYDSEEYDWSVISSDAQKVILITNYKAPKKQVMSFDIATKQLTTLIPESTDLLESVSACGKEKLIVKYLHNVTSQLFVYNKDGKRLHEVKLPDICDISSVSATPDNEQVYFDYNTFTAPQAIYSYDAAKQNLLKIAAPETKFNSANYITKQVFYTSRDGKTKIPLFIIHKKDLVINATTPCFLFGYGGFSSHYAPEFRIDRCLFLEQGGIYAVAGIRGGDEFGEEWHKAGTKERKQNVFNDFIDAADYLVKNNYTSHEKLAIHGRSNGGLLIGAVITQRPDICKVAIPTVGVLDMLRYHKFTIGWAWATDYGTSDTKDGFEYLYKYSPLHNVKKAIYPATLITTGDHDDRVVPAHSFKFAATLQENNKGTNPTLIRIDTNAGHGAGKPVSKQIDEYVDMWSFIMYNLGIEVK